MAKQGSISIVDSFDHMKNTFFPACAWKNKMLWESLDPLGKILRKNLRPNTFPHFTLIHCTRQSQWNELFTLLMNIFSVQLNMSSVQKISSENVQWITARSWRHEWKCSQWTSERIHGRTWNMEEQANLFHEQWTHSVNTGSRNIFSERMSAISEQMSTFNEETGKRVENAIRVWRRWRRRRRRQRSRRKLQRQQGRPRRSRWRRSRRW